MRNRLIGLAILFSVVGSAAFQIILLVVAGWYGIEMVGATSLNQSIAVLVCAIALSDLKSLSIRNLVSGYSLDRLCGVRNTILVVIFTIAAASCVFAWSRIFGALLAIKASSQAADVNLSVWQKEKKPEFIFIFCLLRYGVSSGVLALSANISKNFFFGLICCGLFLIALLYIEHAFASRISKDSGISWKIANTANVFDSRLASAYAALSLAAGLNFLPQTILRYFVSLFGGMKILGSFSIQYQVAMLCIPLITAFSQQALARREVNWQHIASDLLKIGVISIFLLLIVGITFNTPASIILKFIFKSWDPISILSSTLILISSLFLCLTVYLGFMSVALEKTFAQSLANIVFLFSILALCPMAGLIFNVSGIIGAFALATLIRLILLFTIVRRAGLAQ